MPRADRLPSLVGAHYHHDFEDAPEGDYYARASGRVLRNTADHLHRCLRDTSPTVHVGPHS
jgi:hypothetical protein